MAVVGETKPFDVQKFKKELVEEVKRRPMLYDADEPAYKDKNAVEDAWNEVVDVLDPDCRHDLSVDFAKKHWKALRDDFFRRNKKLLNNEVSRDKVLKWPLFTNLEFLRAHYKRPSKAGSSFNQSLVDVGLESVKAPEPVVEEKPKESPPKTGAAKRKASVKSGLKKRKKAKLEKLEEWNAEVLNQQALDATNNNVTSPPKKSVTTSPPSVKVNKSPMTFEEEEHYARSIAATLRRFSPKVRSFAKARIQQLLFDLEFGGGADPVSNGKGSGHHGNQPLDLYTHKA